METAKSSVERKNVTLGVVFLRNSSAGLRSGLADTGEHRRHRCTAQAGSTFQPHLVGPNFSDNHDLIKHYRGEFLCNILKGCFVCVCF